METLGTAGVATEGVTRILPPGQSLILVALISLITLLVFDRSQSKRFLRISQIFLIGIAVILTFNRSFWVALLLALIVVGVMVSIRAKVQIAKTALFIILFAIIALYPIITLAGDQIGELVEGSVIRLASLFNPAETIKEGSLQDRGVENSYVLPQIVSHPLIGLGLGADYRPWDWRIDYAPLTWDKFVYIHNAH